MTARRVSIAGLAFLVLLATGPLAGGRLDPVLAAAQGLVPQELRTLAAQLFRELADLRGLPAPGQAPAVVVRSRDERRRFIVREFGRKYPPARLDAERRAMVAWGLVPIDFDLTGFLTDLVLEQAAAYYDPIGKTMVLANWLGPDAQRDALTHELVHALQDRQVDLDTFLVSPPGRSDETLARQAVIEGEAVALSLDLTLSRQGQSLDRLADVESYQRAIDRSATGPVLSRAPRFVRSMLTFPYAAGLGFVHELRRRSPWSQVRALYRDPPRSTAQILHPELYFDRRQPPVVVPFPDLVDALGPGGQLVIEDDAGEFGLREILRQHLGDQADATGWRGDRYAVWNDQGPLVLVALTLWDSEGTAGAFFQAYARLLGRKLDLPLPTGERALSTWRKDNRAFALERRGRAVLVVERIRPAILDGVRQRVWDHLVKSAVLY
jgi:hypothetical protein